MTVALMEREPSQPIAQETRPMRTSMKHLFAKIAVSGWLLLGGVGIAAAGSKDMVYIHNYTAADTAERFPGGQNIYDLNVVKMPSGRLIPKPDAETRLEAELQAKSRDLAHHEANVAKMDKLAASDAAAAKTFGPGYSIQKTNKTPRLVWDIYVDTPDGKLAGSAAAIRLRIENGFATLNYKPGTRADYDNGMAHRVEAGIKLGADAFDDNFQPSKKLIAFLSNPNLADNPLRELLKAYPGTKIEDFFHPSAAIKQTRAMYDLVLQTTKHGEISVDAVHYADPATVKASNLASIKAAGTFYRVELEGDHVGSNPTAAQIANSAKAPHDAVDSLDPDNEKNPDIIELHRLADALNGHLGTTAAGMAKVTEARIALGKPVAKSAAQAGTMRLSLAKPAKFTLSAQAAKPVAQKTRAPAKKAVAVKSKARR